MLLAPGKTSCGALRLDAVRSSQAISPCFFSASQSAKRFALAGAAAAVKRQASNPNSRAWLRMISFIRRCDSGGARLLTSRLRNASARRIRLAEIAAERDRLLVSL